MLFPFEADANDVPNELGAADIVDEAETMLSGTADMACCDLPLPLPLLGAGDATDGAGALTDLPGVGTYRFTATGVLLAGAVATVDTSRSKDALDEAAHAAALALAVVTRRAADAAAGDGAGDANDEVAATASRLAIAASMCSAPAVPVIDGAPRRRASRLSSAVARAASMALIFFNMTTIFWRCELSCDWQSRSEAWSDSSVAPTW